MFKMDAGISRLLGGKDQSLLVIDSNNQTTSLALVTVKKNQPFLEYICATQTTNPNDDLQTLLTSFSATAFKVPQKAILICNELALTLLDLPSDPTNPITDSQMQEFVRWEIELVVNEQSVPPSVIELLLHHKHLSYDDLQSTFDFLKNNNQVITPALIHQELINKEAITQESFDACQRLSQARIMQSEEIDCAWSQADLEESESDTICIGIKVDYRNQWLDAFDQYNIHLLKLCSSQLCPAYLITERAQLEQPRAFILLDFGINYLSLQLISDNNILQSNYINIQDSAINADDIDTLYQQFQDGNTEVIYWQGIHPEPENLISELQQKIKIPIKSTTLLLTQSDQLNKITGLGSQQSAVRIMGAVSSLPNMGTRALAVGIAGHPPPPPVFKQAKFQFILVIFIVIFGIASQELYIFNELNGLEQAQQKAINELQNKTTTNETIQSINTEVAKLKKELIEFKKTHAKLSTSSHVFETILLQRQKFSQNLLPMLENTIPNEVILESVVEEEWYEFSIKGWALTQASIDNFNSVLSRTLEPWEMYIRDSPSQVNGIRYDFTFFISARES
jgi:hypothetical protein